MTLRFLLLALLLAGCPKPVCLRGETRCMGALAEVCLADRTWKAVQDCAQVSGSSSFVCCDKPRPTSSGATCVPEAVCR